MTSLTGSTSKMRRPRRLGTSSISARSVQKTSGLFNDGPADDLKSSFKPSADDLLSSLDNEVFPLDLDSGMLGCFEDPLAEASLDSFVDINTFFNEGKTFEPMDGAAEIDALIQKTKPMTEAVDAPTIEIVEVAATPSRKRKLDDVEVVDVVDMEEVVTTSSDHDYVTKRPRLSTSSVVSESGASSSAGSPAPVTMEIKYRERRDKNNVASRRSRESRKQKFVDMEEEADRLVIENEKMTLKIVELEKLAKEMKAILVSKLAGK